VGHIGRAIASDPARSNGPYEMLSYKYFGKEAELVMCDEDENSSISRERRGDRCSVHPKTSPSSL